jgi:hypothetical protein
MAAIAAQPLMRKGHVGQGVASARAAGSIFRVEVTLYQQELARCVIDQVQSGHGGG